MTDEQIMKSVALKKRFCKDANIPITVFDEPYFLNRLFLLDQYYGCVDKFKLFFKELEHFSDEQSYFEFYNSVKDSVIKMIQENEYYMVFNTVDNNMIQPIGNFPNRNLYIDDNDNQDFISIDMKKANFSALRFFNSQIFKNAKTWEQYIGMFTNCQHIINSKYIRQVIMGACNPKKQIQYERHLTTRLAYLITQKMINVDIFSVSNDEIIIKVDSNLDMSLLNESLDCDIGDLYRVESFSLKKLGDYGWMKTKGENQYEIKCADGDILPQIIKYLQGKAPTDADLVFRHNHMLARFLDPIDNPFVGGNND